MGIIVLISKSCLGIKLFTLYNVLRIALTIILVLCEKSGIFKKLQVLGSLNTEKELGTADNEAIE